MPPKVFRTTTPEEEAEYARRINMLCTCEHSHLAHNARGKCIVACNHWACECVAFTQREDDIMTDDKLKPHPLTAGQRAMQAAAIWDGPVENRNGLDDRALAKLFGTSRTIMNEARWLIRHAAPEVTAAVKGGLLSVGTAKRLVQNVVKEEQVNALPTFIEASKGDARYHGRIGGARIMRALGQTPKPKKLPMLAATEQLVRSIESMAVCTNFLPEVITRGADFSADPRYPSWIKSLKQIRRDLTRATKLLKQQSHQNGDLSHGQ
jgi:hypothetical protein